MIFTYGTLVKIVAGTYIGCIGTIADVSYRGFGVVHYRIDVVCKTEIGSIHSLNISTMNGLGHIEVVKASLKEWQDFK